MKHPFLAQLTILISAVELAMLIMATVSGNMLAALNVCLWPVYMYAAYLESTK
jgi:hypothetical protein